MNTTVRIAFPDLDDAEASEHAQSLLSELKQNPEVRSNLDLAQSSVARDDPQAMDFGATLIVVLGTPAIVILARAIKSWMERTGTAVELNGVRIDNVRSQDIAAIIGALEREPPAARTR